jgi:hypothetical protein
MVFVWFALEASLFLRHSMVAFRNAIWMINLQPIHSPSLLAPSPSVNLLQVIYVPCIEMVNLTPISNPQTANKYTVQRRILRSGRPPRHVQHAAATRSRRSSKAVRRILPMLSNSHASRTRTRTSQLWREDHYATFCAREAHATTYYISYAVRAAKWAS